MKYSSVEDANFYLHDSIVKYKDSFVYVASVEEGMIAKCYTVGKEGNKEGTPDCSIKVEDLDLTPVKLGYVLDERNARSLFIERVPTRAWRQGLTTQNCKAKGQARFRLPDISSRLMVNILSDRYYSINKAARLAKKFRHEVPFHRFFSIDHHRIVRYKTQVVGGWGGREVVLLPSFRYLQEMLRGYGL